jgi:hypothetical protein
LKDEEWVENFITYDNNREQFIAWDETQAYEIGDGFDTWFEAKEAVLEYAKTLNY